VFEINSFGMNAVVCFIGGHSFILLNHQVNQIMSSTTVSTEVKVSSALPALTLAGKVAIITGASRYLPTNLTPTFHLFIGWL
jgi:hypothetical protein